jgi:hypothetical protein
LWRRHYRHRQAGGDQSFLKGAGREVLPGAALPTDREPLCGLWIDTKFGIQIVDFVATAGCLAAGVLPAGNACAVTPPLLWVFLLC